MKIFLQKSNDAESRWLGIPDNKVGAEIGRNSGTDEAIAKKCYNALQQGKLIYY